ncbi:hypothetical protein BDZ94DRAFT_1276758 [Collybia nuda]|uniref:Uncharacterized protein n=1 Tax=Collybia nuda TaxID=64659 RepID=A0A9P5XSP7_9AGAR|nr:hypothetical protein BDZ94DRAFT_1276758 [Collybia nuda]
MHHLMGCVGCQRCSLIRACKGPTRGLAPCSHAWPHEMDQVHQLSWQDKKEGCTP